MTVALDASALLAMLRGEPGADKVKAELADAVISAVNLSEVTAKLSDYGMPPEDVAATFAQLDLDVRAFDAPQAYLAGRLRQVTRGNGLSLGDRACLALASQLAVDAMTADHAWAGLSLDGITVQLIR